MYTNGHDSSLRSLFENAALEVEDRNCTAIYHQRTDPSAEL